MATFDHKSLDYKGERARSHQEVTKFFLGLLKGLLQAEGWRQETERLCGGGIAIWGMRRRRDVILS